MTVVRILITGANGFVGRALCQRMIGQGFSIRGTVRSDNGIAMLPAGIEAVNTDSIGPNTDWSKALTGVDIIVHLAARAHVMQDTSTDPLAAFREVNVDGTRRLMQMATVAGVQRFVFLSSVGVNGYLTHNRPFTEEDDPHPYNPYTVSKYEAEQVLRSIALESRTEVIIIRSPLVYGPGNPGNFLRLLRLVDQGWPLPFASVTNRRSMIYLGNLVDAIITCCVHPNARGETFLVSDGEDVSTPELIRMIAHAMHKKAKLFPSPQSLLSIIGTLTGKKAELDKLLGSLCIDSSKIRKVLNWNPPFKMRDGIHETVKCYKNR